MHSHHNMTRMTLRLMRISIPFCQPQAPKRGGVAADIAARDAGGMVGPAVALGTSGSTTPGRNQIGHDRLFQIADASRYRHVGAMRVRSVSPAISSGGRFAQA